MNALFLLVALLGQVNYEVAAVRARVDDTTVNGFFPEIFNCAMHPKSDLVNVTTGEVILAGNGDALFDPKLSLDGQWLYYARIPSTANRNSQRGAPIGFPREGCGIYRIHLATKQIVRLTDPKWYPPTSVGTWLADPSQTPPSGSTSLGFGYGVFHSGPCPLPGGKVAFTSNAFGYAPPRGFAGPHQQLFVLDDIPGTTDQDGWADRNLECTGTFNVASALHPTLLTNGEIAFSSLESQGNRDQRVWGLWHAKPDGRAWGPIFPAYVRGDGYHFQTQRSNGNVVSTLYYNLNNWGYGALFQAPLVTTPGLPTFLSPDPANNPAIQSGYNYTVVESPQFVRFSTMRRGMTSVTPWVTIDDSGSVIKHADGTFTELGKFTHPAGAPDNHLLCTYSPGMVNALNRPQRQTPHAKVAVIKGDIAATPDDFEILFEHPEYHYMQPIALVPWTEIYGSLPPEHEFVPNPTGTPFARLQLASSHLGQWKTAPGMIEEVQGGWTGHTQEVPAGIDIVAFEPVMAKTYWTQPDTGWSNGANERMRLIARIMFDELDRPSGDTSADILIPADVPIGMRTFGSDGRTIALPKTWKQGRPGEGVPSEGILCPVTQADMAKFTMHDCGGCHNHSDDPIAFVGTYASGKAPFDFRSLQVRTPEFNRDVKPILDAKCNHCHNETHPVKLDASLATSIYVKPGNAWVSRLSKAIHGGDTTGPMPPEGETPLTDAEIRAIDEWIDYWCLVSTFDEASGKGAWSDITRPTVYVPRSGALNIGAWDYRSAVTVQAEHNGQPLTLPAPVDGVYQTGLTLAEGDRVKVTATDGAGNVHTVERYVRATVEPPPPTPPAKKITVTVRGGLTEEDVEIKVEP